MTTKAQIQVEELCPKCGKPMPKTERYVPFRSTFYNCPDCFPELEPVRAQIMKEECRELK